MATDALTNFERPFRSPEALQARELIEHASASGLKARQRNGVAIAIESDDSEGKALFSVIANQHHALV